METFAQDQNCLQEFFLNQQKLVGTDFALFWWKFLVGKFSTERDKQSVSRLPVGEAVRCRCEDMKALPVALITVASIGIVSLIGIGLFFALLPTKTKISPQTATLETTIMPITSTTFSSRATTNRHLEHQSSLPTTEAENNSSRMLNTTVIWSEPPPPIRESTVEEPPESDSAEDVLITPRTFNFESWTEQSPWTESVQSKAIGFITSGRSGAVAVDPGKSRFTLHVKPTIVIEDQESVQLVMINELELDHFGKASGMTLRNHILAVCSYTFGQIVLLEPETLKKLTVLNCDGCTLFDLDIMSNGDIVSVDAKHEKVIKMRSTGERLAERHVHGATRGVSVCMDDRIYVLVEGGPYIHLLDSFLNNLGTISFYKNQPSKLDCRYLLCIENLLHISCDDAVYLLDVQNGNVTAIQPTENSVYGLGIGVDASDNVFAAKRGSSSVDVFTKDGQFLKTLNADQQFLWSDMTVAKNHIYAIDYINAKIVHYIQQ
ncbi:Tripartite motif-containing protein [Trichinella spiralis]|uniref:Tripartite motif-containing protein n=1 Tax=Trichinella spiralis TaxID=6334 RepID=A0ABR3KPR6_TRISP